MIKINIKSKIFITYLLILIITFFVTTVLFNLLSQRYLIKEARQQLRQEGVLIAKTLEKIPLKDVNIREIVAARRELKLVGRFLESKVLVLNNERRVLYTNLEAGDRRVVANLIRDDKNSILEGFVVERIPIMNNKEGINGHVILLSQVKEIKNISEIFRRTQLLSIFIAGLIALIIGSILGRSLTKPLENLMKYMIEFSLNKPQKQLLIKTGDEIEKLALCFHKLAEKLRNYDEYQKKFLQNTSHELKTPLMSIQGYAEAIKDGVVEGKEAEESLDIIIEESQRLKKVVEEIIYLTKLENADDTFELTYFKIGLLAEGVVKSLKALAAEKQIDVEIKGDLETGGYFDEGKLRRALINIIANCLRYAKRKVIIDLLNNGSYLEIKIFDDGPGLKDGEEEKIFNRFYKGEQGGTGLGLAITRAIIEGHGGSIEAFKREPTGAVFVITLPLKSKEVCY